MLRKREAALAEATAERDAAAGERGQLEQQAAAAQAAIDGGWVLWCISFVGLATFLLLVGPEALCNTLCGCANLCFQLGCPASTLQPALMMMNLIPAVLSAEVDKLKAAVETSTASHKEAAAALEAKRARLRECDSEIRGLEKERQKVLNHVQDIDVEKKRKDNKWVTGSLCWQLLCSAGAVGQHCMLLCCVGQLASHNINNQQMLGRVIGRQSFTLYNSLSPDTCHVLIQGDFTLQKHTSHGVDCTFGIHCAERSKQDHVYIAVG